MTPVAIIPGIVAIYWMWKHDYRQAYIDVYLFSLFLLPGWCRFPIPALPDPTFCESALLPIFAVFLLKFRGPWKWSFLDLVVFAYAAQLGGSEFHNAGFADAQNLMFDMVASGVLPYVLAKGIVEPNGLRVAFAKKIVGMLAFLVVTFLYEARFGVNPYRMIFDRFFPGQGDGWVTTFRYGLARTAGPYGHAILAGIVMLIGFSLARWLEQSKLWEPRFKRWHPVKWSKARILSCAMFAGLFLTMVRGPQIGALLAFVVNIIGSGRNPRKRAWLVLAVALAIGVPAAISGYRYAAVGREHAKTTSQESAAYRKELIDKYEAIALEHFWIGWGRNGWPKVSGMPSIDNYYLLLALMHGFTATLLLLTILISLIVQLLRNGFLAGQMKPIGSSLSFCLAGVFAGITFSVLTVYMGDNIIPIFFTMVGFADGYLQAGGDLQKKTLAAAQGMVEERQPRFATVLA